ncbi:hypothetical protein EJB10_01360 [Wolbachia endosymbiont of Brugia malayi]|uniref:hypothetical protein n=1 Tax=Wolbachia endosymbiont of Brugia malayi TaxID=80849 RepID=UPI00004C94D3|nr:hypothetical protein [Wolbachia endosymbiont of Brugia malayi]AAW71300.1 Predicted protein [Wolbachia endosymbiont strain TRS of Brugia malayi]QCB61490.1 hypothetical protein EJB10_01360 [Wolbachia endosymbiont of Brugia malayi]
MNLEGEKQLYITGRCDSKIEMENGYIHLSINSVGTQDNSTIYGDNEPERMKELLGFSDIIKEFNIYAKYPIAPEAASSELKVPANGNTPSSKLIVLQQHQLLTVVYLLVNSHELQKGAHFQVLLFFFSIYIKIR